MNLVFKRFTVVFLSYISFFLYVFRYYFVLSCVVVLLFVLFFVYVLIFCMLCIRMLLQFCLRLSQDGSGRGAAIVAAVSHRMISNK